MISAGVILFCSCVGNKCTALKVCSVIRPRGYKTFSCSTLLSMKFQLLIIT